MKVIIDERETSLYAKCLELNTFATIQISKQVLPIGDILFMSDDDTKKTNANKTNNKKKVILFK